MCVCVIYTPMYILHMENKFVNCTRCDLNEESAARGSRKESHFSKRARTQSHRQRRQGEQRKENQNNPNDKNKRTTTIKNSAWSFVCVCVCVLGS